MQGLASSALGLTAWLLRARLRRATAAPAAARRIIERARKNETARKGRPCRDGGSTHIHHVCCPPTWSHDDLPSRICSCRSRGSSDGLCATRRCTSSAAGIVRRRGPHVHAGVPRHRCRRGRTIDRPLQDQRDRPPRSARPSESRWSSAWCSRAHVDHPGRVPPSVPWCLARHEWRRRGRLLGHPHRVPLDSNRSMPTMKERSRQGTCGAGERREPPSTEASPLPRDRAGRMKIFSSDR